ncbi:MAG: HAMP domain-containing histidine kinase [Gammaproteobacteria bacterium]|nr:HAMP domain-containing histidine kinase [Gammaproteobacteria bacterium]
MKIRIFIPIILILAVGLASINIWLSRTLDLHLDKIEKAEEKQFNAYRLADHLRHSSDDLTRFARKYIQTGNLDYKDHFVQVLAIRDGKLPRPINYDGIYWDLVIAERLPSPGSDPETKAISLRELVRQAEVTNAEFALINQALERSDKLALIEELAFAATEGNYKDPKSGKKITGRPNHELARELLYDKKYLQAKADIMQPLADFVDSLTQRTHENITLLEKEEKDILRWQFTTALGLLLLTCLLSGIIIFQVLKRVGRLARAANKIKKGNLKARSNVKGKDELGHLGETFDHMIEKLASSLDELEIEKKEVEAKNLALHEESEIKNRFIGMAAHDLRNPLSSIRGFSEIILENPDLTVNQREFLKLIKDNSSAMLQMVNELLDVSVIESGGLKIKPIDTNLKTILNEHLKVLQPVANAKQINLIIDIEDECNCQIDPDRIGQVIDNLVSNAIKFSHNRTTVTITISKQENHVLLSVRDEGPGLTDDDKSKMFGDFQRLSARPTGNESSTGLGLSIVKRIINAHNGEIIVDSIYKEGTTFTVKLPIIFQSQVSKNLT